MSFLQEFKEFALKGNVMDLAVGVIIGAAFGKIVESLVGNIIMPIVALAGGSPDFKGIALGPVKIGSFVQTVVDFAILAFCIFLMVKAFNMARRRFEKPAPAAAPPPPPQSEVYLKEIRDALVARK
jgi:large conductance mechanosensitive channel